MDDTEAKYLEQITKIQPPPRGGVENSLLPNGASTAVEIDRIRDIIFGGQQRDIERRFKNIERRADALSSDIQDLIARQEQNKIELDNRLSLVEERLIQEVQNLENRLQNNRREIYERLASMERQFIDRLARVDQKLSEQQDTLTEVKVDRFDLGDLLIEAGMHLRKDNQAGQG